MYEVKMAIYNIDKPNKNKRIYPKELFKEGVQQIETLPVTLNGGTPIGACTVTIDYPDIEIDSRINIHRDILSKIQPALHGRGKVDDYGRVTEYHLECIDLVHCSAHNSRIVKIDKIVERVEDLE